MPSPFSRNIGPRSPTLDLSWSQQKPPEQLILFAVETPALHVRWPRGIEKARVPISPDTSLPWSEDYVQNGWSARMFLHQMLCTSQQLWNCSNTELLLLRSTLVISQVRVAEGNSSSEALLNSAPNSNDYYLTPRMVLGLCRRAVKRKRRLQRVLLRTQQGWRRRTLTVTNRGKAYEFSLVRNVKPSRGSPEAGLMDYLARVVGG